jgi:hypothetical protein
MAGKPQDRKTEVSKSPDNSAREGSQLVTRSGLKELLLCEGFTGQVPKRGRLRRRKVDID